MNSESGGLSPGEELGDFRILNRLGEGGMGVVYLARDERLDRRVALKVIAPQLALDPDFRDRFAVEARSAAAIDHPNAVPVYSSGTADGSLYIAMRYVEGTDLRRVLHERGGLDPAVAVAVLGEIAAALDAAHATGLVHRDVKPANILLEGEPGRGRSYLTDFGLTKGRGDAPALTGTGQWIGTLDYVAPEQMTSGRVDARTDVYALGCVLYEMLTGSVPFAGGDAQKMYGHVNEPVPGLDLGDAGPGLSAVIGRATAKDPGNRFPSAGDMAQAATAALSGETVATPERSVATGVAAAGMTETATARPAPARPADAPTVTASARPRVPDRATARMASPGGQGGGSGARAAAIVGAALVIAAALVAAAVIVAGGGGEAGSGPSGAKRVARRVPRARRDAAANSTLPDNLSACAANLYVPERRPGRPYTSCPFAREVSRAYYESGKSSRISAYSPATGKTYAMSCGGSDPVLCTGGTDAAVYITPAEPTSIPTEEPTSSAGDGLGDWPGGSGYSAMLGAFSSETDARARQREASERGLDAGVLYSSNFSSLRPGYWIVFSGTFASTAEAAERAARARELGFSDSYPRLVSP